MRRLLLMTALVAAPAAAKEFTLFIHEAPAQLALRGDPGPRGTAYWAGYAAVGGELVKAGVLRGGGALEPAPGRRATPRLSGFFTIDVADLAAARAWAAKVPATGGRVDVLAHAPARTGM